MTPQMISLISFSGTETYSLCKVEASTILLLATLKSWKRWWTRMYSMDESIWMPSSRCLSWSQNKSWTEMLYSFIRSTLRPRSEAEMASMVWSLPMDRYGRNKDALLWRLWEILDLVKHPWRRLSWMKATCWSKPLRRRRNREMSSLWASFSISAHSMSFGGLSQVKAQ